MAFDDLKRTLPGNGDEAKLRFWLEYEGRTIELRPGIIQVGRSSVCQIMLDDALVSRRHAQFVVTRFAVTVEDLGSVNGVYLNSSRLKTSQQLKDGDRVQIGKSEFMLRSSKLSDRTRDDRRTAETLHNVEIPAELVQAYRSKPGPSRPDSSAPRNAETKAPPAPSSPRSAEPIASLIAHGVAGGNDEPTRERDAVELLGIVADKVLVLGRGDEAERIMSTILNNLLSDARATGVAGSRSAEKAVHYALKIAEATGRARWVDYCFELYHALKKPLPAAAVDELYGIVRKVEGISLSTMRAYLTTLQALAPQLGPSERFVVQRLEGLERVAAS